MPRNRLQLFALLAFTLTALPAWSQLPGVHWQQDIEAAKATARRSGRLVLVHVWADGCAPCHALEQNVFAQPGVSGAIEAKFVPVKLNANEFPATAQGFGITRVPTDVVLTPDGQIIGKMISPATPVAYIAETTEIANQFASQSGRAYQTAAAEAPPQRIPNQAYANLAIGAQSTPAQVTPTTPGTDPYANAIAAAPVDNRYSLPLQQSTPVAATNPAAAQRPGGSDGTGTINPYAGAALAAPSLSAATSTAPTSVGNPYAATGAMTSQSPTSPRPELSAHGQVVANATNNGAELVDLANETTGSVPDVTKLPAGAPPLAFEGYCPVSMRGSWKWVPGNPEFGAIHRGRTYWFASKLQQQQFLSNPDYYSPALSGVDPVLAIDHGQSIQGLREHSLDYDNQFYMFSSEATLQQFTANPARYAAGVRQAMGIESGRQVR